MEQVREWMVTGSPAPVWRTMKSGTWGRVTLVSASGHRVELSGHETNEGNMVWAVAVTGDDGEAVEVASGRTAPEASRRDIIQ